MKKSEGKKLDEYFREGLNPMSLSEIDEDWEAMKVLLQKNDKRKKVAYFTLLLSSIAAMLLLIFSLFFNARDTKNLNNKQLTKTTGKENRIKLNNKNRINPSSAVISKSQNESQILINNLQNEKTVYNILSKVKIYRKKNAFHKNPFKENYVNNAIKLDNLSSLLSNNYENKDAIDSLKNNAIDSVINSSPFAKVLPLETPINDEKENKFKSKLFKPSFVLAFSIAPDMSGVNSLKNNKIGYGVGINLLVAVAPKLRLSTGIIYGQKTYDTGFSNYKPNSKYVFQNLPYEVKANCEVIDVPLNISYVISTKNTSKLALSTGISTYFMLTEKYYFEYENASIRGPRKYSLSNQNQHYLGIANVSVSYEKNISPGISLGISPYLKLPLTNIGYGNVNLQSAGVAISVQTDIIKHKK